MEHRFKQRLTGAVVLVALGVIFLPMLLSGPVEQTRVDIELDMPAAPETPAMPELPTAGDLDAPEPGSDLADQPAPRDTTAVPEGAPAPTPPQVETAPDAGAEPTAEPATEPATEPEADTEPAPRSETATAASGFFVQVGAFGSRDNARRLAATLRDDGFEVHLREGSAAEALSHRVQVGPYPDRNTAEREAQALADRHELAGFIVEP